VLIALYVRYISLYIKNKKMKGGDVMQLFLLDDNAFSTMITPIIKLLNDALGPIIALVVAVGAIYCVFLGVKLAKAEEPQDREKAKGQLKNSIIGFLLIFILIVALRLGLSPLQKWMDAQTGTTTTTIDTKASSNTNSNSNSQ
jgi:hypothetical protein